MIALGRDRIGIAEVARVARDGATASLDPEAARRMVAAQETLQAWSRADRPVYGLTRGLGNQATKEIPQSDRRAFSTAMLQARASGGGAPFPDEVARAALFVRAATLARGGAGARPVIVETQLEMLKHGVAPRVPQIGSIGTSDLLLCANLALPLVGLGSATLSGETLDGAEAMRRAGVATVELTEKEGLALCSSNAMSIGFGALVLVDALHLLDLADAALALTYEAFGGNPSPFDPRIAAAHPAAGQVEAAARLRALLRGSALNEPGVPRRIQDPISLRCATHVHGAALTAIGWARDAVETELNCAADNPLILADDDTILSTGNFHTAALALTFDALRLALTGVGTASAQRTVQLLDPVVSGLGTSLQPDSPTRGGVRFFSMVAHTLNREARDHSAPVSNDDATPFGVEDVAPFTLSSVRRAAQQIDLLHQVLACELIIAAQALDVRPLTPSAPAVQALHALVRREVPPLGEDRSTTGDIARLSAAIRERGCLHGPASTAPSPT